MMLIFRLFLAFLHALALFYLLNKAKQKINPLLLVLDFVLSIALILSVKFGLL
jgi:hypothetical protein